MRHFFWHLVWVGLSSALTSSPSDLANFICHIIWLVVYLPLWKIWKSVGMIIPIYYWKKNVPNHQPVIYNDSSWPFCWRVFSKTLNHVGNMWGTCGEHVGKMWGKCGELSPQLYLFNIEPPKPCTKPFTRGTRRKGTLPNHLEWSRSTPLYFFLVYFNWFSSGTLW